ncbi:MAG: hypothetical protein M1823_003299 [Watsoniomyces obsoletus]|nr:MAG: hypothetical protein M1823_003299 [Watsoniomyces obsoletus]
MCLQCRYASTTTANDAPPLLLKIRKDMVAALKSKDTNRLNVLRGLLADATNAAKTNNPIKTDLQVLALLRKRSAASKTAMAEFEAAQRVDLKEKEESQVAVLEEYVGKVDVVSEDRVKKVVEETIASLKSTGGKLDVGTVLKKVMGDGGPLGGKPVERSLLAQVTKEALMHGCRTPSIAWNETLSRIVLTGQLSKMDYERL